MTQDPRFATESRSASPAILEMQRRHKHGRVRPMHEPTLIERLLRRF